MTPIRRVTVLGAGTMGRGIAHVAAQAGFDTTLRDLTPEFVEKGMAGIRDALDVGVAKGKVTPQGRAETLARIRPATDLAAAVQAAHLVIEAVPETLLLKQALFKEVERHAPPEAVLATNTSSLSIDAIGAAVADPGRLVGMHFFNPPHLLKLVEVVRGARTRPTTVDAAVAAARQMGKEPIIVKDSPGFASSRLGLALGLEAIRMLEQDVATAEDIDKAMELGYNHPMGPLRLTDLVGLDVRLAIADYLHQELKSDAFRPPELLRRMVKEGRLGRKSGRGFYAYDAPKTPNR